MAVPTFSFTWLYAALIFSLILSIIATVFCFIGPSYIVAVPNSTSVTANHTSASSFLYGGGVIGIFIILSLLGVWFLIPTVPTDPSLITPAFIASVRFGIGSFFLILILFILVIVMLFFIIYALSLIDVTVTGPTGTTVSSAARWFAIGAAIMMVIVLILVLVIGYQYYSFDAYLASLAVSDVNIPLTTRLPVAAVPVAAIAPTATRYELGNEFIVYRDPDAQGRFIGDITIDGAIVGGSITGVNESLKTVSSVHVDDRVVQPVVQSIIPAPTSVEVPVNRSRSAVGQSVAPVAVQPVYVQDVVNGQRVRRQIINGVLGPALPL